MAFFGLILGACSLSFLVFRLGVDAALRPEILWRELVETHVWAHLGAALSLLALYGLRWGRPSVQVIHAAEIGSWLLQFGFYGMMAAAIPQVGRPDALLLQILGLGFTFRALYVPSQAWRTVLYGVVLGVALLALIDGMFNPISPRLAACQPVPVSAETLRWMTTSGAVAWWTAILVLSSIASSVLYGLRREVRRAKELGQYTLERKLGEGGMGAVYVARHAMLRRPTALKLLHPDRIGEETLARFEREVRMTARLSHPNTVTVFDYGRTPDGIFYYAMELIDGANLAQVVSLDGPMVPSRVVHILRQAASALAEAHDLGLVHRDLKPENILLSRQGGVPDTVKVVDFGLVKELERGGTGLTREDAILGTPRYMAPEMIRDPTSADPRSDIYALGAVAYFLLTGTHVFDGSNVIEVASHHLADVPEPPSARVDRPVPEPLELLVLRCLAKDPDERPASAAALLDLVEALEGIGPWSRRDAARWWRDLAPDLSESIAPAASGDTVALEVDLRRRT